MSAIGTLVIFAGMVAFVLAAIAVFRPMPRLLMATPKAAAIGMLLSVSSCFAGGLISAADPDAAKTPASSPTPPVAAQAQKPAATEPKPPNVGPLQDSATAMPERLAPDPDHPSASLVRHIEDTLDLWDALDRCRRDADFRYYGIVPGGPCGNLAEVARALRDDSSEKDVYQMGLQCTAGDVAEAAIDYVELSGRRDPEQLKYVNWVRGHMEECRKKLPQMEPKLEVSRATMEGWPLTVESGVVGCDHRHRIWFQPTGSSVRYAVNGTAKAKFKNIKPIWAKDPAYPDTSDGIVMRKMMTPLIAMGESLC